jgi:tetratricopeptide (TPR) repeat protein
LLYSRETGCKLETTVGLRLLGRVALSQEKLEKAAKYCQRSHTLLENMGDNPERFLLLRDWGLVKLCQGDITGSITFIRESLIGLEALNFRVDIPECLEVLARAYTAQGRFQTAAQLAGVAASLPASLGTPLPPILSYGYDQVVAGIRVALGDEQFLTAWEIGQDTGTERAISYTLEENPLN